MRPFMWIYLYLAVMIIGLVLVAVAIVKATSARSARGSGDRQPSAAAAAARSHALRIHVAAWCALLVAAVAMATASEAAGGLETGRVTGLVLAAGGLAFLAVSAFGEITWPRPTGSVRTATLTHRSVRDVTPRPAVILLAITSALLVVALLVGGFTAFPDGRSYGRSEVLADGSKTSWASGPYPGWFYALPLLIAAAAIIVAGLACLILIARRPAISDASLSWDLALRRLSAQRALRGATLTLGATAAPVYGLLALPFLREGPIVVAVAFLLGALASIGAAATAVALPGSLVPVTAERPGTTPGAGPDAGRTSRATASATDAVRRIRWTMP
ncbi:hypothetical protein SAMN05216410_0017 [Sanguibacter gelidistatuariae]|uniref:Uncharacterized protein n=1 Tax=Sanguibacter gelidistatuariae TaxID=1814289 RepID=A0A1G6WWE7_9MICO|nr:hypothetical protein [Sanguibacter gelidistatuariae]SDD69953.1 hypothetical protein SAMN05216410_0017 [Sanguibacter gelidistatuariae]